MIALLCFCLALLTSPFKSKSRLEAENAAVRHQVIVPQRRVRARVQLRLSCVGIEPASVRYWRCKSRSLGGRPEIDADLRALIRRISAENPLWGAPRIH